MEPFGLLYCPLCGLGLPLSKVGSQFWSNEKFYHCFQSAQDLKSGQAALEVRQRPNFAKLFAPYPPKNFKCDASFGADHLHLRPDRNPHVRGCNVAG